jgi:5'(3')-deoxyribonucleotidase
MRQPVIIDLDETVYPFIETWSRWLHLNGEGPLDIDSFRWWYDLDLYLSEHVERQPDFIEAQKKLKAKPIPEAFENLQRIAQYYPIIALTARNKQDWYEETAFWINKRLPFVENIYYSRLKRGSEAVPKNVIAEQLNAYALIDDTKHWVDGLSENIRGYVVKRPFPLASDANARSWDDIAEELIYLHPDSMI